MVPSDEDAIDHQSRIASVVAWAHEAPLSVLVHMWPEYTTAASLLPSDEDAIENHLRGTGVGCRLADTLVLALPMVDIDAARVADGLDEPATVRVVVREMLADIDDFAELLLELEMLRDRL